MLHCIVTLVQTASRPLLVAGDKAAEHTVGCACMHIHHQSPDALWVVVSRIQVCSRSRH